MSLIHRIEGSPGTLPQGEGGVAPAPPPAPAPTKPEILGVLRFEGGHVYVEARGERIRIDDRSAARLLGGEGLPATRPEGRPAAVRQIPAELVPALEAVRNNRGRLEGYPGVVGVRAGYKFIGGRITRVPSVVVSVAEKLPSDKLDAHERLPTTVDGVAVDVAPADPYELLSYRRKRGEETEVAVTMRPTLIDQLTNEDEAAEALEVARRITYEPPPGATLREVFDEMTIVCHVSPDAGWRVLEPFIKATKRTMEVGMYDFTAPHIYRTARSLLRDGSVKWQMTLGPKESLPGPDDADSTKAEDLPEANIVRGLKRVAGDRFQNAFAAIGSGRTFASAYHIKVLVQDSAAFWLSSGNWQSSNQPDIDFLADDADRQLITSYNREWHVVVNHPELAKTFQTYLKGDFKTASTQEEAAAVAEPGPELLVPAEEVLFEERTTRSLQVFAPKKFVFTSSNPVRVQPILTPDNYDEVVLRLLRRKPKASLYFQNQSLNPVKQPTEEFDELMRLMVEYSNDDQLDVRIIFRNIGPIRKKLESLQAAGFNMERIRVQSGCHTKGIIVDSAVILLGSHNFTNDGTQFNRDASLLIHDAGIAGYYQDVFLHDWERLAKPTIREEAAPRLASSSETSSDRHVRIPWAAYASED